MESGQGQSQATTPVSPAATTDTNTEFTDALAPAATVMEAGPAPEASAEATPAGATTPEATQSPEANSDVTPGDTPIAGDPGADSPENQQAIQDALAQGLLPKVAEIPTYEEMNKVQLIDDAEKIQREQAEEIERRRAAQAAQAEAERQAALQAQAQAEAQAQAAAAAAAAAAASRASFDPNLSAKDVSTGPIRIETILEACVERNASDVHLQLGLQPILRIDGSLTPIGGTPRLTEAMIEELVSATMDEEQRENFKKDKEIDYSFAFGDLGRFRVNAFHERGNTAAAFRLIPNKIPSLESLNMPGVVASFADYPRGLVLVTGPTGSGKSTTLAALIDKINTERATHIITIEDPIEYAHTSKRALVAQREIHHDTYSFAAALRSVLREDPDVVLVGEMRDLETISSAITIAETGHLVFATLHTNSAAQSVDRIVGVFPPDQQQQIRMQLANVIMAICSQRLVPKNGGGRIAAAEILVANAGVRSIIREGKTHQLDTAIQTGAEQGMQSMDSTLAKMISDGTISYETAMEFAVDPDNLTRLARG